MVSASTAAELAHGEVWWSEGPSWGRRPVLILTRDTVVAKLSSVIVAPITSVVREIPTEVPLDEVDGMPRPCVVNLDGVENQPRSFLTERVTRLGVVRMHEVCVALAHATGC